MSIVDIPTEVWDHQLAAINPAPVDWLWQGFVASSRGAPRDCPSAPELEIPPGRRATFVAHYENIKSLENGYEYFLSTLPTQGFDLRVTVRPLDLDVSATPFHPQELREASDHNPALRLYHWKIERPILPYQGLCLAWKARRPQPGTVEGAASLGRQAANTLDG